MLTRDVASFVDTRSCRLVTRPPITDATGRKPERQGFKIVVPIAIVTRIRREHRHAHLTDSIPRGIHQYTRKKVEFGLYNNASEVIREALRLMLQRD